MKARKSMKTGEILETIVILVALVSLIPVAYWSHMGELPRHGLDFYYKLFILCLLGYMTYRGVKRLAILAALVLLLLIPVAYRWHMGELPQHGLYFNYLFFMMCLLGHVTYRRVKRLMAALRSSKKRGSGPPMPPFFR